MLYLYLDESGEMGFDFCKEAIQIFYCDSMVNGIENNKKIAKVVKRVLRKKFSKQKRNELNGLMFLKTRSDMTMFIYHKKDHALQARYAVAIALLRRGTLQTTCNGLTARV